VAGAAAAGCGGRAEEGAGEAAGGADYKPVLGSILTDYMFRCPARRLATALHSAPRVSRTFAYRFTQRSNHTPIEACRGFACHTMELPFLFAQPEPPLRFSRDEAALARAMGSGWAGFARTGSPGALGSRRGAPWPAWSIEGGETMELRWPPSVRGGPDAQTCDPACDFWDSTGYIF
jgi:carboxylesterase type B